MPGAPVLESAPQTLVKVAAQPVPDINPWAVALTVMLATFMEVLDTSVANVALPHIAGSLSSTIDESTWVLTSYLVSNAIVLPLAGWFRRCSDGSASIWSAWPSSPPVLCCAAWRPASGC